MKALLASLVISALIATTVADFEEYSEDAVQRIYAADDLIDVEREAELINWNTRLQFTLQEEPQPEGMILELTSVLERAPPEDINICGNWIGVKLDQGREYLCNITHFVVECSYGFIRWGESYMKIMTEDDIFLLLFTNLSEQIFDISTAYGSCHEVIENVHNMQILLVFETDSTDQVLLDIPVMRIPSSAYRRNLLTWARQNRVGVISPVTGEDVQQFHGSQQLTFDFTWLRELLRFGVKKSRQSRPTTEGGGTEFYVPRPLLLSDDIISKLWEEVEWFKYDYGSEDTDELSQLDGLAMLNLPKRS